MAAGGNGPEAVILNADGGSRGNPGVAGSGSIIYDAATGETLRTISWVVGRKATNNVAEYQALINGLRAAGELGARQVAVRMDSKLVVEQMSGRWKIKHPDMQQLASQARRLAQGFAEVSYTWVPRKHNAAADELANKAMDAAAEGHEPGEVGAPAQGGITRQARHPENDRASEPEDSPGAGARAAGGRGVAKPQETHAGNSPRRWGPARGPVTTLILLRHGETAYSREGRYSGLGDPELTERGREQARAAAEVIRARGGIDAIVSSPLSRARQTASFVSEACQLPVRTNPGLIEADFGAWEGLTFAEAAAEDAEYHRRWLTDPSLSAPGGESFDRVFERVCAEIDELAADYAGKTVVVVSHVTPIKAIIARALGADARSFHRVFLELASLSVVELAGARSMVRGVNITGGVPAPGA